MLSKACKFKDQAYPSQAPPLTEKNLPDQTGKVFLITGGNTGVGYEVCKIVYAHNAKVYLAARSEAKANEAIKSIKSAHPDSKGQLIYLHLDLSDLTTIKKSADTFLAQESRLDWLDNNAGLMHPPKGSKSVQGYELQLGTNVLGPFLFTKLLTPILTETAKTAPQGSVRVSWAGSYAIELAGPGGIQFESDGITPVDHGGGPKSYNVSKTANLFLAHEFGRRSTTTSSAVLHNAYNPGNLKSSLQRFERTAIAVASSALWHVLDTVLLHPAINGAYTELYSGLSRDLDHADQGTYIIPWGRVDRNTREDIVANMGEGKGSEKLYYWCEQETRQYL